MQASRVERFHAFLLWPLELRLPSRLQGLTKDDNFAGQLSAKIAQDGRWEAVDPYNRCEGEDPDLPYSEFVYFHPFAQRVLFPQAGKPNPALAILKRRGVREVEVALWDAETVTFDVRRVH